MVSIRLYDDDDYDDDGDRNDADDNSDDEENAGAYSFCVMVRSRRLTQKRSQRFSCIRNVHY